MSDLDLAQMVVAKAQGRVEFGLYRDGGTAIITTRVMTKDGPVENVSRMSVHTFQRIRARAIMRLGQRSYEMLTSRIGFDDQIESAPLPPSRQLR